MSFIPRTFSLVLVAVCFVLFVFIQALAGGDDWRPINPADLESMTPVVDKDADAEVVFWEARVTDELQENLESAYPRTVIYHYLRIKVFTERGKESQSKIDITYDNNIEIKDLAARTIKQDGSIVEVQKKDFFARTIVKQGGKKFKAKSFAMPNVEPGALIEYRYREVRNNTLSFYERLDFQRDIPVRSVKYTMKPLAIPGLGFQMRPFNGRVQDSWDKKTETFTFWMENVPAFHEEPKMPPEYEVRPYLLVYYSTAADVERRGADFWNGLGKTVYDDYKSTFKPRDDVKQAATEAIGSAATDEEKLKKLLDFVRLKIKNSDSDTSGLSEADRAKLKANKSPADTLKGGMGTERDISLLFGAMAAAAGFEVRVVRIGNRRENFFNPSLTIPFFLNAYDIAVKVGNDWRVIDPSSAYVPIGMLLWQEEGENALVSDPRESTFIKTPMSTPEKSLERRTAQLKLSDDGSLEGDVRIEYNGHLGIEMKNLNDDDSPAQREQNLRDKVKEIQSTAELSNIKIENVTDQAKPFVYSYHVRVAGYAQRTGKRLFLQPAFFEHGLGSLFTAGQRRYDIYFHYPWSEEDEVSIDLPDGFVLDNPDQPAPFGAGQISQYKVNIGLTMNKKTLIYRRNVFFGGGGNIIFPSTSYAALKQLFDAVHTNDNHTITLKQAEAAAK
jgi:transglutaminase-like putative cysteine protease